MESKNHVPQKQGIRLGGITKGINGAFDVWVLSPTGSRRSSAGKGLTKPEADERLTKKLAFRIRKCEHLRAVRTILHDYDRASNVVLREFVPIVEQI